MQAWENIDQFYEDEEGIIWAIIDDGLYRYNGHSAVNVTSYLSNFHNLDAGNQSGVRFLFDKDETVWYGDREGLYKINLDSLSAKKIFLDEPAHNTNWRNYIVKLEQQGDTLFVGTANGLYLIDKNTDQVLSRYFTNGKDIHHRESSNTVESIFHEIEETAIWVALASGLFRIDKENGEISRFGLEPEPYPYPHNFHSGTRFGDILLMTSHGIGMVEFNLKTQSFEQIYTQPEKPWKRAPNVIRSAIPINDSILLVNALELGNGLYNRKTREYSWLKTPEPMKDGVFLNLDRSGFVWASKRGRIFRSKEPVVDRSLPYHHVIDISSLRVNDILTSRPSIEGYSKIHLAEGEENIHLEFSISKPYVLDEVQYQYQLNAQEWTTIKTPNNLQIFGLPSGNHYLRIRALDSNGSVLASRALELNLHLPFFKSKAFIALSVLILSLGLYLAVRYWNSKKLNAKLRELDMAKSTFFANISHEFRTPLTLIQGPIEDQLENKQISTKERESLKTAQVNMLRLESLVDQLLALSKLESGNLKLQVQPGSIGDFIKVQCDAFRYIAQHKDIHFINEIDDFEEAWFDHDALDKIIVNLLGNAFKYAPEGSQVGIKTKRNSADYQIEVKNTGSYLTAEEKKQIFTRFYQSNPNNPGTGIGLALTKELVELHKGTIQVRSDRAGGTIFSITIPMDKEAYSETEILSGHTLGIEQNPIISKEEILRTPVVISEDAPILLIVDDNKDIRNYLQSIFEDTFTVRLAENGKVGLDAARREIPDVIISDVMMPEIDGYTFTELLKTNPVTSHIPILLLTAKTEVEDRLNGTEIGADMYLTKPFSTKILKASLHNLLDNRRKLQDRFAQEIILTPKEIAVTSADAQFLERLQGVLDEYLSDSNFSAAEFGRAMGVSRMQLHRKLKALTGQSTTQFLRNQRLKAAAELIKQNKISISEVGYTVGFSDPSYFTKCFKEEYGISPREYTKST
ncbi:MAG: response regulator [Bacteroidota bacterium]